ncbi:hypothetical protein HNQ38_002756 [Desulfovibrio intestinalis]|uniref:Uncharacterized protein n=1 Tax=Desulfovibrio intestinalis TaxID=58621 RepID=A0A7W8C2Y8_9BACT|nr:hypothetical protein [Desulfovibrio intestinalis]
MSKTGDIQNIGAPNKEIPTNTSRIQGDLRLYRMAPYDEDFKA